MNPSTYYHPQMNSDSYIRVLHASPDAPPVDIYANGNMIAQNLEYTQITSYLPVPPGNYNIRVFPTGVSTNPVINTNVAISPQSQYTVAANGLLANISLLPIIEPYVNGMNSRKSYVRFVHLSPNAPSVDITLPDGTVVFRNVGFRDITNYLALNPGEYTLQVRPTGTSQVVLTIPNVRVSPNMVYTIYALGLLGATPPLEAMIVMDGMYA